MLWVGSVSVLLGVNVMSMMIVSGVSMNRIMSVWKVRVKGLFFFIVMCF